MKACSPEVQDPSSAAQLPSLPPDVQCSHVPVTETQAATCDQTGHSSSLLESSRQSEELTPALASELHNFYQHSLGSTKSACTMPDCPPSWCLHGWNPPWAWKLVSGRLLLAVCRKWYPPAPLSHTVTDAHHIPSAPSQIFCSQCYFCEKLAQGVLKLYKDFWSTFCSVEKNQTIYSKLSLDNKYINIISKMYFNQNEHTTENQQKCFWNFTFTEKLSKIDKTALKLAKALPVTILSPWVCKQLPFQSYALSWAQLVEHINTYQACNSCLTEKK